MIITLAVLAFLTIIATPLLFMLLSKRKERNRKSGDSNENPQENEPFEVVDPEATGQETTETFELFNPDDQKEPDDRNPKKHFK